MSENSKPQLNREKIVLSTDDLEHYKRAMHRFNESRARFEEAERIWNDEQLYILQKYDLGQQASINPFTGEVQIAPESEVHTPEAIGGATSNGRTD